MATSVTCTLAASGVVPKYVPTGAVTLAGRMGVTHTISASHAFLLCKIPHGAHIVDGWVNFGLSNGAGEINIGLTGGGLAAASDDPDAIAASVSASNSVHRFVGEGVGEWPLKCSVSDNARNQFAFLTVTDGSGISSNSAVGSLVFAVTYTFDLNPS